MKRNLQYWANLQGPGRSQFVVLESIFPLLETIFIILLDSSSDVKPLVGFFFCSIFNFLHLRIFTIQPRIPPRPQKPPCLLWYF